MATKLYKRTFKGRPNLSEVHDEIGRHGGVIVRIDQSDAVTIAYFERHEMPGLAATKEAVANIEEVSLKEVTKI
jgi:hypothetical protein